VALVNQSLPAIYLWSARMQHIGPLWTRMLLPCFYIGVPNVAEVHGNLTDTQLHLAMLCLLILLAAPRRQLGRPPST